MRSTYCSRLDRTDSLWEVWKRRSLAKRVLFEWSSMTPSLMFVPNSFQNFSLYCSSAIFLIMSRVLRTSFLRMTWKIAMGHTGEKSTDVLFISYLSQTSVQTTCTTNMTTVSLWDGAEEAQGVLSMCRVMSCSPWAACVAAESLWIRSVEGHQSQPTNTHLHDPFVSKNPLQMTILTS